MSAYQVEFADVINSIAFCSDGDGGGGGGGVDDSGYVDVDVDVCGSVCVQHGVDRLTFLSAGVDGEVEGCVVRVTGAGGQGFRECVVPVGVCGQCEVQWPAGVSPRPASAREMYHWAWPRRDLLLAVFGVDGVCFLVFIEVVEARRAVAKEVVALEDCVVAMAASPTLAALQLASGSVVKVELATRRLDPWLLDGHEVCLPAASHQLLLCPLEGVAGPTPLALTPRGRLYLGHRQVLAGCTSVLLHTHHLLATTAAHTLLATPLTTPALAALEETASGSGGGGVRRVERGARLVCGVGHDTRVVLQMPRGNLEVVSPRPLALHALGRLVGAQQYGAALTLALRHRIDTNLLYDHQPDHFLAAADHFVQDVAAPQRLDVFLAALTDADCTTTTYAFHYPARHTTTTTATAAPGKVVAVCVAVRAAMEGQDKGRLLLPILTSLVRCGRMEEALARLGDMRRQAEEGQVFPVGPEEGLRHLLYLADTDELYRVALGTYDLSLALMVAQRSKRDPKEYLAQLNSLAALPGPLQRFRINATLQRFTAALHGLDDTVPHRTEALAMVDTHGLHALALPLLPDGSEVKATVCHSYGRRLLAQNRPGEAAIMLGRAGQHQAALEAYRSAGNWQMALVMAARLGLAKERVGELCRELAEALRGQGRHTEAARLYEHHLADEEEAVACLTAAGEWQDALRLAHHHGRPDLLQTHVQPGARQQAAATLADMQEVAATITSQVARLAVVRAAQQRQHTASLALAAEDAPLDSDLYSDTSTVAGGEPGRRSMASSSGGGSSSRSQRSSKSRRKMERKKYSLREGSATEDLALLAALHHTYTTLQGRATTTTTLCTALLTLGHDAEATHLHTAFAGLLKVARAKQAEIWPVAAPPDQEEFGPQLTTQAAVDRVMAGAGPGPAGGALVAARMAMLEPHLRFPPPPVTDAWQLTMLAPQDKAH
ncbi:Elongator complex protein 1 [Portunus trituberculatus]|uniref:Elongator complex protein 1 n=1 Tax=Portunus trituberculatus TaxID=210409 RepID=A0A5B7GE76_PORTR|nr:Elongator complex protein 1 [Portunus trituberculatus]